LNIRRASRLLNASQHRDDTAQEVVMTRSTIRLIRFGSAKTLTQAQIPYGELESGNPFDGYGV